MKIFPGGKITKDLEESTYNQSYMLLDEDFFITWVNFYISFDVNRNITNIELHLGFPYNVGVIANENELKNNLNWKVHYQKEEVNDVSKKTIKLIESKIDEKNKNA